MKKLWMVLPMMLAVLLIGGCAADSTSSSSDLTASAPQKSGSDVLVPDQVVRAIPNFNSGKPVYAACDQNLWFSVGTVSAAVKASTQMIKEGDFWRIKNMVGQRFHPVQLDGNDRPIWAQLEKCYELNESFIDHTGGSPAILVR